MKTRISVEDHQRLLEKLSEITASAAGLFKFVLEELEVADFDLPPNYCVVCDKIIKNHKTNKKSCSVKCRRKIDAARKRSERMDGVSN